MQPVTATGITLSAVMDTDLFLEAFVAKLVLKDWRGIDPFETGTRRALSGIVAFLDQVIDEIERNGAEISDFAPLVHIANRLRPSALGGVERWDYQLRTTGEHQARRNDPSSRAIDLMTSKRSARRHLEKLTGEQADLMNRVMDVFDNLCCNPVPDDSDGINSGPVAGILPDF